MINRRIKIPRDAELNKETIDYILDEHRSEKIRIDKLEKYYNNHADIFDRKYENDGKPHNYLATPYANYITTMAVGYFLGKQITYKGENEQLLEKVNDIFKYNDEHDHNTTLAKRASIGGYAVELLYIDEDTQPRFKAFGGNEVAIVYDDTIEDNILYAIRYWQEKVVNTNKTITKCEIYTGPTLNDKGEIIETGKIMYGTIKQDSFIIDESKTREHFFKDVPAAVYINNDELYGDFEKVMSLIDEYNKVQSDTANDFEYFTNAMLVISGYVVDDEASKALKDMHIINFQDNTGDAKYLIKDIQDTALENYKNRLDNDIHKFSLVPNLSDESFASNISGEAMKYKLMGLDNMTSVKEAKFRKGLMRRIELICNYLRTTDSSLQFDFVDIEPVFTRNRPVNELEIAQMMQTLTGILSEETIIGMFPAISDPQAELKKKQDENESVFEQPYEMQQEEPAEVGEEDVKDE